MSEYGSHSIMIGWPLDELGPLLCAHLGLNYDENWRHPDSKSTWHLSVYEWIEGIDLMISYTTDDWGEIGDGRHILGVFLSLLPEHIADLEGVEFYGLKRFSDFAKQNKLELPPAHTYFYENDQAFGWAVDTFEWSSFKERLESSN